MTKTTIIGCQCGKTHFEVTGEPILVSECLCNSCRAAAARLERLPGAKPMLTPYQATPSAENLREFRLTADAGSRRIVATCCNTPVFLEMKGAHWLSVYLHLWPAATRPKPELRTMVGDLNDASALPADIRNLKTHHLKFYAKLLKAWIAMGFRTPKIDVRGAIDA